MTAVHWGEGALSSRSVRAAPATGGHGPLLEGGHQQAPLTDRTVLLCVPPPDCPPALAALEAAGASVRVVADAAALRRAAVLLGPAALVVADLRTGPPQLRAALHGLSRQDAVVVLAEQIGAAERIALLQDGADHVGRSGAPTEVVALLSTVLRRSLRPVRQPDVRQAGDIAVDVDQRTARVCGRLLRLTALEFDLLAYFVSYPGRVLSRQTLLADVWGYDMGGLNTVTVHIRRLRSKIEPDPAAPAYLRTIWGVGYKLEPTAPR